MSSIELMEMDSQKDEVSKLEKELADIEHQLKLERDKDEGPDVVHFDRNTSIAVGILRLTCFFIYYFLFRVEENGQ